MIKEKQKRSAKSKKRFLLIICILILAIFANLSMISAEGNINNIESHLYYKINLKYNFGKISIESKEIIFSQDVLNNFLNKEFNVYDLEIKDFNNNVLENIFFSVPNIAIMDIADNKTGELVKSRIIIFNQTSFEIFIPYYENAKEIVIYDNKNIELDKTDVSSYSKTKEFSKEGEEAKQAQEKQAEETGENFNDKIKNKNNYLIIGLAILLIMLVIILINKTKKKK